ncbi:MAG: DUF1549 domain-containing protein, partial [Planctomycetales bacterium]|nr:DUF1549 domain-containing protein [Planctomycetales bacterium]
MAATLVLKSSRRSTDAATISATIHRIFRRHANVNGTNERLRSSVYLVALLLGLLLLATRTVAQEPAASARDAAMSERVDTLLEEQLRASGWPAAESCSDETFLRRAHLDLTGTLPAASEVVEFSRSVLADKRSRLIDRLVGSPAAASHLAQTWAGWMLPEQ